MKRRLPSLALTGLLACGLLSLRADDADAPPPITTSSSQHNPEVTCTTSDTLACADTLQLADDARQQLAPLLKLGPHWRFPVNIHVMMPGDPLLAKVNREAAAAFADNSGMHIVAVLPSTDPDAREFIQRQFVTAMLWEKFFANTKTFDSHTKLDVVPTWLIAGLAEWLNEDPDHNRERIVRKAAQEGRAPSLVEIASWTHISKDRLLGLWQRAFCYYLVNSITRTGDKRDNFQQWLASVSDSSSVSAQRLFPTEMGWQRELVDATQRSRDIVYTWDETVAELASEEVINLPSSKPSDSHVCTLDTVTTFPYTPQMEQVLQQKIYDLTELELRAHPSWHPTLELYRSALAELIKDKNAVQAQKLFLQAREVRVAEMADHQKLVDYINWFEVTRDYPGVTTHFETYFKTAHELEQAEANPAHPNPIREDVLHVESQL